ncbi:hypothetical protein PRIPAC_76605, partial [Pristionchus pacificus]|uniref:Uncharacterized protein n=1 Tax=Pristionchus pacificus TaxID=54126 RepID=A0A2A6BG06_PRIPA
SLVVDDLDTVGGIVAGLRDSRLSRFLITDELRSFGEGRGPAHPGANSDRIGAKLAPRGAFVPESEYPSTAHGATMKRMHAAPFSYTQPTVLGRGGAQPYYDVAPADPLPRGLPRDYRTPFPESRMSSYGYGSRSGSSIPYATGSGAEYMARQGWDRGGDERSAGDGRDSVGKISFYGKSNNKRFLAVAFCLLALLLIAAIVVIILFICGVFRPALPPIGPDGPVRSPLIPPLAARMGPLVTTETPDEHHWVVTESSLPLKTTTETPQSPTTTTTAAPTTTPTTTSKTTTTTTFSPIVERNESRVFQVVLFVVQQANTAYNTRTSFAYMEAFRMINDAVINLVTTSTLQQYTPMTTLEDLRNSGDDLEVRFSIQLTAPSRSAIDAPIVRNVLVADMFKLEARLNQVVIDRNRLTLVQNVDNLIHDINMDIKNNGSSELKVQITPNTAASIFASLSKEDQSFVLIGGAKRTVTYSYGHSLHHTQEGEFTLLFLTQPPSKASFPIILVKRGLGREYTHLETPFHYKDDSLSGCRFQFSYPQSIRGQSCSNLIPIVVKNEGCSELTVQITPNKAASIFASLSKEDQSFVLIGGTKRTVTIHMDTCYNTFK